MGKYIKGAIIVASLFFFASVMVCTLFDHPDQFFWLCVLVGSTFVIDRWVLDRK